MNWQDLRHRFRTRGQRHLRTYLVALVLATLVPTVAAGVYTLWRTAESYREASGNRLADTARTLAHAIERDMEGKTALVQTLAAPSGGAAGPAGLQEWLDGAGLLPGAVVVTDAASLPADAVAGVMRAGEPAVSNLFTATPGGPPRVAIVTRQARPGAAGRPGLLAVTVSPDQLVQLAPQDGPTHQSMLVAVTDGTGHLVARSRDASRFVGKRVPDWDKVRQGGGVHGLFEAATAEGLPIKFAFQRLDGTPGWVVVAGEPLDTFNAGWMNLLRQLLLGGALAVAIALALAVGLARQILRPVATLARDAERAALGEGVLPEAPARPTLAIQEFELLRDRIEVAHAALRQRAEDARRNADALTVSERRYRTLAQAGALVLWRSTADGALIAATGWESLTGQPEGQALGFGWLSRVHPDERRTVTAALGEVAAAPQRAVDMEFRLHAADGGWRWVRVRGVLVEEPGRRVGEWVGVLEDVDERRRAQAHVAHLAHHDSLTGLPNRTRFRERLLEAIRRVAPGMQAAVLYLDLDRFKEVNDTLGHPAGDALLQAVTQRLGHVVREGDTVARLGGDEFAVAQGGVAGPQDAEHLADRIVAALATPYELNGHHVRIGASVGIMMIESPESDPDHLLACADLALYDAKQGGRGRYRFFEPAMDARLQSRKALEGELAGALAAGQFGLTYDPVVNVRFGTVCGFEARVHWASPRRGPVPLHEVAAVADDLGLTRPLGDWTLQQACLDAAAWPGDCRVAVDVSDAQLRGPDFPHTVQAALRRAGLPPQRLELEVGEQVLIDGSDSLMAVLHRLKALGVRIVIDHFGSGRSAFGCLTSFPFDKVKIEETHVRQLGLQKEGDAVVRALTTLCDTLGIASAASGVDAQPQFDLLSGEECVEVQGRLFGGGHAASDVAALLADAGDRPLFSAPRA